jgi:hypothetical protein
MRSTQIMSRSELFQADASRTARRAMSQDRATDSAQAYHRNIVAALQS